MNDAVVLSLIVSGVIGFGCLCFIGIYVSSKYDSNKPDQGSVLGDEKK